MARILCIPLAQLRLREASTRRQVPIVRQYRWVYYRPLRRLWVVRRVGHPHVYTKTQLAAAKVACCMFKLRMGTLQLGKPSRVPRTSIEWRASCFRALWFAYRGRSARCPVVPGDLADLAGADKGLWQDPRLLVVLVLAKYGPHRRLLEVNARRLQRASPHQGDVDFIYAVLCDTLVSLRPLSDAWRVNVGWNTWHHAGLAHFALRLGVLEKIGARGTGAIQAGTQDSWYRVLPLSPATTLRLAKLVEVGEALARMPVPTTIKLWALNMQMLHATLRQGTPVGLKGEYTGRWLGRTWMLHLLGEARATLHIDTSKVTAYSLMGLFPDQCKWLVRFARSKPTVTKLADVLKLVGYDGPIELFTMYCCLFGAAYSRLAGKKEDWLMRMRHQWRKRLLQQLALDGVALHPEQLVRMEPSWC